jgi:hypothetical protein
MTPPPAKTAPFTAADGRKFGLTVGIAFLVFAAISRWRGHELPPIILGGLGAVLVVAGLVIPGMLGPVNRAWMGLAHVLSKITTPIFMGVVYFLVLTPTGLLMRALGKDPLKIPGTSSAWLRKSQTQSDLERQF